MIILGPQKSGSTALQFFLKYHPQLVTNPPTPYAFEEIQFFSNEGLYSKGVDWYVLYLVFKTLLVCMQYVLSPLFGNDQTI